MDLPRADADVIAECLHAMRMDGRAEHIEPVTDEPGSYRLTLDGRAALLKHAPAGSPPHRLERLWRELEFSRRLAAHVPLAVSRLLGGHAAEDFGVCGLWAAHQSHKSLDRWLEEDYLEAVAQLAQLHAAYWNRPGRLSDHAYLRRDTPESLEGRIRAAYGQWRALKSDARFANVLTDQTFAVIREALVRFADVERACRALPATLVHGDFRAATLHTGAGGNLIWMAWGDAGIGRGTEDMAAFLLDARVQGVAAPTARMLTHYHAQLKVVLGDVVSMVALHRSLAAAELRRRLLDAPFHLREAAQQDVADEVFRVQTLANKLELI